MMQLLLLLKLLGPENGAGLIETLSKIFYSAGVVNLHV